MKPFSSVSLTTDVVLRAVGIAWVVFNHAGALANRPYELGGGLQILLLLSGYSFARFSLTSVTPIELRRSVVRFAARVALPAFAILFLAFAILRRFDIVEALFVGNLVGISQLKIIYIWYPQVIVQLMLFFWILSFVPGFVQNFQKRPLACAILFLAASVALLLIVSHGLELGAQQRRMPHWILWNFVLGWVVYFALYPAPGIAANHRFLILIASAAIGYVVLGVGTEMLRFLGLLVAVAAMLFVRKIVLPGLLAQPLTVLSQAAFTIFLTHLMVLKIYDALALRQYKEGFHLFDISKAWLFSLGISVGIWIVLESTIRAWRHFHASPAVHATTA